jgi:hypothetical protein
MLLDGLAKRPTAEWVSRYGQTKYKKEFVESRTGQLPSQKALQTPQQTAVRKPGIGQWLTLMHRNSVLRLRDKGQLMFTALQSILFPLLMAVLYHNVTPERFHDPQSMAKNLMACHFLLVVAAVWFGVNNAARDIVGEWAIFVRERMVSLKLPSYVFSKLGMLAIICGAQCTLLLGIVYPIARLKSGFGPTLLSLFLVSIAGAALGLLISSFAETTEAAIAVLPIPLLFMILLSGGMKILESSPEKAMSLVFPSRWSFEANYVREAKAQKLAQLEEVRAGVQAQAPGMQVPEVPAIPDDDEEDLAKPWFNGSARHGYKTAMIVLLSMTAAFSAGVIAILRKRDIQR